MGRRSRKPEPTNRSDSEKAVPGPGRFRGWRGWLLRLSLAVLAPLLFVGLFEVSLRLTGYGYPTGFYLGPDARGGYTTNYRFGWRFFPRLLCRDPMPCLLSAKPLTAKPAGTIRIFVLGSSAAQGIPDPSFSFGAILAVMLRDQFPDTRFEVINGAMVAINSHTVLEIARDCADREPDLFVVYTGNNEVTGPFGPGTVLQPFSPSLRMVRANLWVKSTRVGQLLNDVTERVRSREGDPSLWREKEMSVYSPIAADDPRLAVVYDHYRQNLTDICAVAQRGGAAVVLSTIAVNLRDFPPMASLHRSDLSPEDLAKWESLYKQGGDLEGNNRWPDALEQFDAAAKIDDRYAELQFRLGQCLLKAGRFAEARERFESARDLDALRVRADSHINAIVRQVAAEQDPAGFQFVDAERILAESDPDSHGIPGADLFYEHVHLTFAGNYQLARAVLDHVCQALPQLGSRGQSGEVPSLQRCAELLTLTPWDEYQMAASMERLTARQPFANQWNYGLRQGAARRKMEDLRQRISTPEAMAATWETYEAALAKDPDNLSLHLHFSTLATERGRPDLAAKHLQVVVETLPWDPSMQNSLAMAWASCGKFEEAIEHYQQALKIKPNYVQARDNLGRLLMELGRFDEAIIQFQAALKTAPDFADAEYSLGEALAKRGQIEDGIAHLRRALELNPNLPEAQYVLGFILVKLGQFDQAIVHLEKALELSPNLLDAQYALGIVMAQRGRLDEAVACFRKALELNPRFADAEFNLGNVLAERGQWDEAVAHLQKAVELRPDDPNFRRTLQGLQFQRDKKPPRP